MTYKLFEDFYKQANIKHLLLHEHKGTLVSLPFCTDRCKDYNKVMYFKDGQFCFDELKLPNATSKFSGVCSIQDSIWAVPYAVWDDFNIVLQIKNGTPIYHKLDQKGKGQFYSLGFNESQAFSFPLGYEGTSYAIHIDNDTVQTKEFDSNSHIKMHMGTTYCNKGFYSPPRGDSKGYNNVVCYKDDNITLYPVKELDNNITRKYSDFIKYKNKLYALPFGEKGDLKELLIFDTETNSYQLQKLDIASFSKKYNGGVLLDDTIVALPYGTKEEQHSNKGLLYNCETGEHSNFSINEGFGGKYRFRCGIEFNGHAVFIPSGTPSCPIYVIDKQGNIVHSINFNNFMLGRPVKHDDCVWTLMYHLETEKQFLLKFNKNFVYSMIEIPF